MRRRIRDIQIPFRRNPRPPLNLRGLRLYPNWFQYNYGNERTSLYGDDFGFSDPWENAGIQHPMDDPDAQAYRSEAAADADVGLYSDEIDEFDYWANAIQQLSQEAIALPSNVQSEMREYIMGYRQDEGDKFMERDIRNDALRWENAFYRAGVNIPSTGSELQEMLTRSMYPSFISQAQQIAATSSMSQFDALSSVTMGYLNSLSGWQPTREPEIIRGSRMGYYDAMRLEREYEAGGTPTGTFSLNAENDEMDWGTGRIPRGYPTADVYGGGWYSEEYDAMRLVDKYIRRDIGGGLTLRSTLEPKFFYPKDEPNKRVLLEPNYSVLGPSQMPRNEYETDFEGNVIAKHKLPWRYPDSSRRGISVRYAEDYIPSATADAYNLLQFKTRMMGQSYVDILAELRAAKPQFDDWYGSRAAGFVPYMFKQMYMGGDDFIFGPQSIWRWEEHTQSRDWEMQNPLSSYGYEVQVPGMPRASRGEWLPGVETTYGYQLPRSYFDMRIQSRMGPQGTFLPMYEPGLNVGLGISYSTEHQYLKEYPYFPRPNQAFDTAIAGFAEGNSWNWKYQIEIGQRIAQGKPVGSWLIDKVRGGAFDEEYYYGQQQIFKSRGRGYPMEIRGSGKVGDTGMLPVSYGDPRNELGQIDWRTKYYHRGLSGGQVAEDFYDIRAEILYDQGRLWLPEYAGQETAENWWANPVGGMASNVFDLDQPLYISSLINKMENVVEGEYYWSGVPLLGPGGSGENQFYGRPQKPRPYPIGLPATAGAPRRPDLPFARQASGYQLLRESVYASGSPFYPPPEEDWEIRKREAGETYMALNPRTGAWEEEVPGENQFYGDYGTEHIPPASPAQYRDYQGWLDASYNPMSTVGNPPVSANYTGIRASGGRMGYLPFSNRQSYYAQRAVPSSLVPPQGGLVPQGGRLPTGPYGVGSSYQPGVVAGPPPVIPPQPPIGPPGLPPPPGQPQQGPAPVGLRNYQNLLVQEMMDALTAGRSVMGSLRPGFGKTEAMAGAAEISPISLVTSPLGALNAQHAKDLAERGAMRDPQGNVIYGPDGKPVGGVQTFNLIGDPGYGEDRTEYEKVHKEFREAVETSIDPATGQLRPGKTPIIGIMSMEKMASLTPNRGLGAQIHEWDRLGWLKVTSVDEVQEIGRGGRLMLKKLAENIGELMPNGVRQLLGGTITRSQEHMLAGTFGVDPTRDIKRATASMGHLNVLMENVQQSDYVATGGRYAQEASGGQIIYGYSTRLVDLIEQQAAQGGRDTMRYHKGLGTGTELIPEADLQRVQEHLLKGLGPNETAVGSPALGLGLNIPDITDVAQIGAARPSDIIQRALRVRPGRNPDGSQDLSTKVGEFRFAADPRQYEDWARRAETNVQALGSAELARAFIDLRASAQTDPLNPNWREASQQMDWRLGQSLKRQMPNFKGIEYFGGEASRILQEAGLINLRSVPGPGGEDIQNWTFEVGGVQNAGGLAEAGLQIEEANYTSEFDSRQKNMRFREFRTQQSEFAAREYRAMGKILRQTSGLDPLKAGQHLVTGLTDWLEARNQADPTDRKASLTALEQFADLKLPKQMADDYIQAVKQATDTLNAQVQSGTAMNTAMQQFSDTVQTAAQGISGSPTAQMMATAQAAQTAGTLRTPSGAAVPYAQTFGQAANVAAQMAASGVGIPGGPGGGGNQPPGQRPQNIQGRLGAFGQGLYASYLATRYWRMFAEPSLQAMQEYGAMEAQLQPLQMYGQGGDYERTGAARMAQDMANARMNLGRGTYEVFSPMVGAFNRAMENPQVARATGGFGVAAGVAVGGALLGAMIPPIAPFAIGAGVVAGTAVAIGTVVRAAQLENADYNRFLEENPQWRDQPQLTPSEIQSGYGAGVPAQTGGMDYQAAYQADAAAQAQASGGNIGTWAQDPAFQRAREEAYKEWRTTKDPTAIAQRLVDESGGSIQLDQATKFIATMQSAYGRRVEPGNAALWQTAIDITQQAVREGIDPSAMVEAGSGYAGGMGLLPGTPEYGAQISGYAGASVTGRATMERDQAWANQFAGQFAGLLGSMGAGRKFQAEFNVRDQAAATRGLSMIQAYSSKFGQPRAPMQFYARAGAYNVTDTLSASALGKIAYGMGPSQQAFGQAVAEQFYEAGLIQTGGQYGTTVQQFGQVMAGQSPAAMGTTLAAMGGDMQAMSFLSWRNPELLEAVGLPSDVPMYNQWGAPIQQTSGQGFLRLGQELMTQGVQAAQTGGMWGTGFTSIAGMDTSKISTTAAFLNEGLNYQMSEGMVKAFHEGGTRGAQLYYNQQSYNNSMAGIGIQMAQIAAQERFLWGGGAWTGTPAPGSLWALQDQQRALAYQSQMAEFAYTTERMQTANQFAIRGEDIQYARMTAGHEMQRFNIGFQREGMGLARQWGREDFAFRAQGMALQRGWAREDWQYEDQMRGLQYAWQMEDIDEAIKMSSGRERKQLVKQRERMGVTHGMEEEQLEKVRERQEQMWKREEDQFNKQKERQETQWAREEEQFEKQAEYQETLMGLDVDQFELNKESRETLYEMDKENLERRIKDYKKQQELQEQIIELQRNHQVESLALQKAALGVQAQQLKEQKEMNDVMIKANVLFDDAENELGLIAKYGEVKNVFYSFRTMAVAANGVSTAKIDKIRQLLNDLHK